MNRFTQWIQRLNKRTKEQTVDELYQTLTFSGNPVTLELRTPKGEPLLGLEDTLRQHPEVQRTIEDALGINSTDTILYSIARNTATAEIPPEFYDENFNPGNSDDLVRELDCLLYDDDVFGINIHKGVNTHNNTFYRVEVVVTHVPKLLTPTEEKTAEGDPVYTLGIGYVSEGYVCALVTKQIQPTISPYEIVPIETGN